MVKFGLLGPLLLRLGSQIDVTAAKQRTVLALLIARRNTPVRLSRIVDELWPEHSPESAVQNARSYISAIRTSLGSERDRLTTRQGSYHLAIDDDEVDTAMFESATGLARSALRAGDVSSAIERYEAALDLWRGEALQDVTTGPSLWAYGAALTESGISTREEYLEARFQAGQCREAAAGLRQLTADHPLRESGWHRLMTVLYRCGDRAGALEAFQEARRALADGLGLDPGPELAALHRGILRGAPANRVRRSPPRQLPRPPSILVGRESELAAVQRSLSRSSDASKIVGIHGLGGVGKSSVAIAAAHAVAKHFPDGQLYVNLQGASPGLAPLEPAEVLGRFMRALGAPEHQISPDVEEMAGSFRSSTARRRILIVLDDARSTAQILPLLPAGSGCGVLITSRRPVDTLDGVDHLRLDPISTGAAVELLAALGSRVRIGHDPEAAQDIARLCGMLPLAVRVMGTRLARHPQASLRQAAEALAQAQSRLDELGLGDLNVRSTFNVGYRALPHGPAGAQARRLFWRLGRLDFAEIAAGDAAALLDVDDFAAQRALDLLTDHGLIESTGSGFRIHDLLRLFAAELAAANEPAADVDAAVTRVARRYIDFVRRNRLLYLPMDGDPPHDEASDQDPAAPHDDAEAAAWMTRHLPKISALVRQLSANPATVPVAWDLLRPLNRRLCLGHPASCVALYGHLVAQPCPDERLLAGAMCTLSSASLYLHRDRDMLDWVRQAVRLLPKLDDPAMRARILCVHATALAQVGDSTTALDHFIEATALYHSLGRKEPVGICLDNASMATFTLGRYDESLAMLRRSLAIARRHHDPMHLASVMEGLAMVHTRLGRMRVAELYASASIRYCEQAQYPFRYSSSLQRRSIALQALGRTKEAIADAEAAVALCRQVPSERLQLDALRNLGVILWLAGDPQATQVLHQADALAQTVAAA